jgi:hypothetical protein
MGWRSRPPYWAGVFDLPGGPDLSLLALTTAVIIGGKVHIINLLKVERCRWRWFTYSYRIFAKTEEKADGKEMHVV